MSPNVHAQKLTRLTQRLTILLVQVQQRLLNLQCSRMLFVQQFFYVGKEQFIVVAMLLEQHKLVDGCHDNAVYSVQC